MQLDEQIGRNVDALISCDLLSYGVIDRLFAAAVKAQGGPLSLKAADLVADALADGGAALVLTGLILPGQHPYGETDGPLGTAVLARALAFGLGTPVMVACEVELHGLLAALLRRAGLQVVSADALEESRGRRAAVAVVPLSTDAGQAGDQAARWISDHDIRIGVSVERNGTNAEGRCCMVNGADLTGVIGRGDSVFGALTKAGLPTLGIGDRGNELGFGHLAKTVAAILPKGAVAADVTLATLALPATVSNWGCYGIACCLAARLRNPELLHDATLETALAETALSAGGIDGMSGRTELSADGIGTPVHAALATMMAEVYRARAARDPSPHSTPLIRDGEAASAPADGGASGTG